MDGSARRKFWTQSNSSYAFKYRLHVWLVHKEYPKVYCTLRTAVNSRKPDLSSFKRRLLYLLTNQQQKRDLLRLYLLSNVFFT